MKKNNTTADELASEVAKINKKINLKADEEDVISKTQHYNAITDILTPELAYYDYGLYGINGNTSLIRSV